MFRLFVALYPPSSALAELDRQVAPLHATWPGLRWTRPALWHVTLAFLGEASPAAVPDLSVRLSRAASRIGPLELSIAGAGTFPRGGSRTRVLWMGLAGDGERMSRLADSVAAAGRRVLSGDIKASEPHVTLARCRRRPVDTRKLIDVLGGYAGPAWTASQVHLVRSHLGADQRHETLVKVDL